MNGEKPHSSTVEDALPEIQEVSDYSDITQNPYEISSNKNHEWGETSHSSTVEDALPEIQEVSDYSDITQNPYEIFSNKNQVHSHHEWGETSFFNC